MSENKSPCFLCWNQDGDKLMCVDHCIRLKAYQLGGEWKNVAPRNVQITMEQKVVPAWQCLIEGCINVGNRRGLCERHYDSWRKGYIEHPIEGLWKPNRKTRPKKAKKTLKHGISDEALRNVEQNLRAAVERIEARKEILDEIAVRIITVDLVKYDELYNKIMQNANRNYVPVEHTIISLISLGIRVVEQNTGKSFGGEQWKK